MKTPSLTTLFSAAAVLAGCWMGPSMSAQAAYENYVVTTLAGPAEPGSGWHDGQSAAAQFNAPGAIAADAGGNLYVADTYNNTIRKITSSGLVTTLAGSTNSGSADGIGASARFNTPQAIAVDLATTNVYVADTENHTIRKITPDGMVTTLAGLAGVSGSTNGVGAAARFYKPYGLAADRSGNVYVADTGNSTIRKITPSGAVSTLAGYAGTIGTANGQGTAARFHYPLGLTVDNGGNVYVADTYNNMARKITSAGMVTTLAGATNAGSVDGTGKSARFNNPIGIAVDGGGNVFVADFENHLVREITAAGMVSTLAGSTNSGTADGTGTNAAFYHPRGLTLSTDGALYVTDSDNHIIRKVTLAGSVTTPAGTPAGPGTVNATGNAARFSYPAGSVMDGAGNIYVADLGSHTIRKITPTGQVTTFAGLAGTFGTNDGTGSAARFHYPVGIAMDSQTNLYLTDNGNQSVRKITPAGEVTTIAGKPGTSGNTNGTGSDARFNNPIGIAVDTQGNIFVGDAWNHQIRKITPAGVVTTLAGNGASGRADGTNSAASFSFPEGVAVDSPGNVYVADDGNSLIRKITPAGVVTTLAGSTNSGSADGVSNAASFYNPFGVALDKSNNVYVTDASNDLIRKITPAGVVTTLAGTTNTGSADGTGAEAGFDLPEGIMADPAGNLYVADCYNHSIRKLSPALSDVPVVDLARANSTGITCHFSITNRTTTSWSWSFLRYPSTSSAQFSATNVPNPTLTPDVKDEYIVRFQGWDDQGRTAIGTVSVSVDAPPAIRITSPVAGQQISSLNYTIVGTASDDAGVSNVWYQLNGGAWALATGTTNWSANVTLVGGANTLSAYAVDTAGNFSATNSVSFTFSSEKIPPTLTILSPKAGQRVSNLTFTATGTASDNKGVASVWCKLNSGDWSPAAGTTSWSDSLTLTPGTNTLWAYAKDTSGNGSKTNSVKFIYVLSDRLTLLTTGRGTLSPNYSNAMLEINRSYSITATPATGYLFSNWTSGAAIAKTNNPKLTFTMASNLMFSANFVPNPFIPTKGTYAGLFQPTNQTAHTNSGSFSTTLTDKGAFSAKVVLGGATYSLSGTLPVSGIYSTSIVRKGLSPLSVQLALDLTGSNVITGMLASDNWTAPLCADRSIYSAASPVPAALAGKKFTLAIQTTNTSAGAPGNYGAGALTVAAAGTVSFSGTLSDGTKVTQSAPLSQYRQWPLYVALYSGKGSIRGWLNFTNSDNSPGGSLGWSKAVPGATIYPSFNLNTGLEAVGSLYSFTSGTRLLNLTNGVVTLQDGNLPTANLVNGFTLGADNRVTATNKLTLTLTTASGLFSGKVPATVNGKATLISINGALLQNQNLGYGNFLGATQTGSVVIGGQ